MKCFSILVLIASIGILLPAQQTLDILTISGRYGLPQSYKETYQGNAIEAAAFLGLTVPIQLSKSTIIVNNLNYFYFNVQGDPEIPDGIANPIILNGFILRTGLLQRFSNGRSMQLLFAPRFMTDFMNVDANSIQLGALVMYEKKFHDELTMGFGAMYNQE